MSFQYTLGLIEVDTTYGREDMPDDMWLDHISERTPHTADLIMIEH